MLICCDFCSYESYFLAVVSANKTLGELYIQLNLLFKIHQPRELCPMSQLKMRCSVSIPESAKSTKEQISVIFKLLC